MQEIKRPSLQGQESKILDISWSTIVKLSVAVAGFYILFLIKDILVWVLFAVVISLLFDPAIDFLQRRRVPRVIGTLLTYFVVFGFIALAIYGTAPIFVQEIQKFSQFIPKYFTTFAPPLEGLGIAAFSDFQTFTNLAIGNIEKISANFFAALFAIFGGIFSTFFVISVAIFLSMDEKAVERGIMLFFPKQYEAVALDVWNKSQKKVSGWFVSRIVSSIFVGGATYLALVLFNVQYSLSLAFLAGILNFIPVIGPLFTAILVGFLVAADSATKALLLMATFVAIQQIEGSVLTPLLTKRFIGLSPALVLIALALGGELWGIMGAILAIPVAGIFYEFLKDFLKKRKEGGTVLL